MELTQLSAISPIDGRYWRLTSSLSSFFSEQSLIQYRIRIEIEYFISLVEIPLGPLSTFPQEAKDHKEIMRGWYQKFNKEEAEKVKQEEKITNHDIKAVEYYLKKLFEAQGWGKHSEFLHFALTSQDINNTAIPLSIKEAIEKSYLPALESQVLTPLTEMANKWLEEPMLARTHGQPATPTRVGKELMVFVERLQAQISLLKSIPFTAKFGGATGQFNAHHVAFPNIDWPKFADEFVGRLGLKRQQYTTQIEHYDMLGALFDTMKRINTILIDLCRDVWTYISLDYFSQRVIGTEVGSSAMPHKVNPIDYENAEGNFGVANALFDHLSTKLPISRLQRDLTDSTVLRNVGVPFSHCLISFSSLNKGLGKLILNKEAIQSDLDRNWAVVAEAIQTILRREGYPKPYEKLKDLTRTGKKIDKSVIVEFIQHDLHGLREEVKKELMEITPFNYIGVLPK